MRDKRFVAEHRGGLLNKHQHFKLIILACNYSEHILHLFGDKVDDRLILALKVAKDWTTGNATVCDARKASLGAIAVANECINATSVFVARCVGHAVATAHMADHSIQAAKYALKAVKSSGQSLEKERYWQDEQLSDEIKELFITARKNHDDLRDNIFGKKKPQSTNM